MRDHPADQDAYAANFAHQAPLSLDPLDAHRLNQRITSYPHCELDSAEGDGLRGGRASRMATDLLVACAL